ncbi:hypothetical protein [Salegentibacter sp.]|uniref:hypothetical protein n=1 Tax=Salegentibacter sp. TaxID=1903072 RepID=UPI003565E4EA
MKKMNFILVLTFLFSFSLIQAQQEEDNSKFEIIAYGGIGYTKVKTHVQPRYDLNVNTGEILLNYKVWGKYGIATGIGFSELSGSGFNETGVFYSERNLLKIPLLFTLNQNISDKLFILGTLGAYGQTPTKDQLAYIDGGESDVYEGWNYGIQLGFGFGYNIDKKLGLGINLNGQSDLSELETSSGKSFNDKQKHNNLNSIGLFLKYKL